jgi:hypothetical protein
MSLCLLDWTLAVIGVITLTGVLIKLTNWKIVCWAYLISLGISGFIYLGTLLINHCNC